MNELAKSVSIYANVVIISCATVAAFLLSRPSGVEHYVDAEKELKSIRNLFSFAAEYKKHVELELNEQQFLLLQKAMTPNEPIPEPIGPTSAPAAAPPYNATLRNPEIEVTETFNGTTTTVNRELNFGAASYSKIAPSCFRQWGTSLPYKCDLPAQFVTVADAYRFLVRQDDNSIDRERLSIFEPSVFDFAKKFRTLCAEKATATLTKWRIVVDREPPHSDSPTLRASPCIAGGCSSDEARLEMEFTEGNGPSKLCTTISGKWSCAACNSVEIMPFVRWIEKKKQAGSTIKELYDDSNPVEKSWLPHSHLLWSDIGAKPIEEAISFVIMKIATNTERITLFGFSASISSASIAFPSAVTIVLWLSFLHLSSLSRLIAFSRTNPREVCNHWFGFFTDRASQSTANALISFSPLCVFLWLEIRVFALNGVVPSIDVAVGLAMIAMCVTHAYQLSRTQAAIIAKMLSMN